MLKTMDEVIADRLYFEEQQELWEKKYRKITYRVLNILILVGTILAGVILFL